MRVALFIFIIILNTGCTLGPLVIEHEEGSLPKARINLPVDECKIKVKRKRQGLVCKWRF